MNRISHQRKVRIDDPHCDPIMLLLPKPMAYCACYGGDLHREALLRCIKVRKRITASTGWRAPQEYTKLGPVYITPPNGDRIVPG